MRTNVAFGSIDAQLRPQARVRLLRRCSMVFSRGSLFSICSRLVPRKDASFLEKSRQLRDTPLMSIATIRNEILGLPPEERAKLIDLIWESLSAPEVKAREISWAAESERRIDAFESGKLGARDAKDVLSDLRDSLRK